MTQNLLLSRTIQATGLFSKGYGIINGSIGICQLGDTNTRVKNNYMTDFGTGYFASEVMESTMEILLMEGKQVSSIVMVLLVCYQTVRQLQQVNRLTTGLAYPI